MKMMPPDIISHENQLQHLSEPSIFMLDVFRTADHAGQIFIPHRPEIFSEPAWGLLSAHKSHVRETSLFTGAIPNPVRNIAKLLVSFRCQVKIRKGHAGETCSVVLRLENVINENLRRICWLPRDS